MAPVNHLRMENRISVCREYAELWQAFFQYFNEDLKTLQVTEEMETQLSNIMTILAINHFKFIELCGEFLKDSSGVMKCMAETVSIVELKEMPEATMAKLMIEVHTLLIDMHKALGKMLQKLTPKQLEMLQGSGAIAPVAAAPK